ncbi:MAG: phosphodiester glycosidase family protein [Oscillospiraceae bacterium]|nr:phosphodiester glycosidase family protein [Oscillospiraceae bacterium]
MKDHIWTVCSTIVLFAFTLYISLDTFVISRTYDTNASRSNTSMFADVTSETSTPETTVASEAALETSNSETSSEFTDISTENSESSSDSYGTASDDLFVENDDENTLKSSGYSISVTEYYENDTKIYVADITLASSQSLKTAFANGTYGRNVTDTTSSIAEENNAVLAINGDYYGARQSGYVIRNGIVYRNKGNGSDVMCIFANGTMEILNDKDYSADVLVSMGVWQAFSFGPALVENSSVSVNVNSEVGQAMASNPRTAVGIIGTNHFVFVVSDGRTSESSGLSLYELATFMQDLGVKTAYNLDGGGSSTMYYNGSVINKPTTNGRISERAVSDIVYIG